MCTKIQCIVTVTGCITVPVPYVCVFVLYSLKTFCYLVLIRCNVETTHYKLVTVHP